MLLASATGCRQPARSPGPAPASRPAATITRPRSLPVQQIPKTRPAPSTHPNEWPRRFEVTEPSQLQPDGQLAVDQPLAILEKFDPRRTATIRATLVSDSLLKINTDNVQAVRLDLLNLPRQHPGRLILHIDGQGIEITGKNSQIIYLQRGSVGEWSFGRPTRPSATPTR
jgi:hypothetical protein